MTESKKDLHVIVGMGKTGLSCARYFAARHIPYAVTDSRVNPPKLKDLLEIDPNVPLSLGRIDQDLLNTAHRIVISPGLRLDELPPGYQDPSDERLIGDIELFCQSTKAPIIAITGTNGKSTVTTLVGDMLRSSGLHVKVGGNLGVPALSLLQGDIPDYYVLELSSAQLTLTRSLQATVAAILNISPDHLDWHRHIQAYRDAKMKIFQHCDYAVYPRDDACIQPPKNCQSILFGADLAHEGEFGLLNIAGVTYLARGDMPLLAVDEMKVTGRHNYLNALAALAIVEPLMLKVVEEARLRAIKRFKGLPHRCEWVAEHNGVVWINDSKATNVGASIASIKSMGRDITGKLILIAGGVGKGADFSMMKPAVHQYVKAAILYGKDAQQLEKALMNETTVIMVNDLSDAVHKARMDAQHGDVVLFAPACASFDMFDNFEKRGDAFCKAVRGVIDA